ncbi:MAG: hypothetical protein ACOX1N_03770 [Candidatus Methanomethylophilaceae archaeon]|jgi:hypothetical protein
MAEPQQIATASVLTLIAGLIVSMFSLAFPLVMIGNLSVTLIAGLLVMLFSAILFVMQALPMEITFTSDNSSFRIKGPYYARTIDYSEVSSVECRKFPLGTPLMALNSGDGVLGGQFKSPEAGMCHAVGHNRGEDTCYIVMKLTDGKTVAFNLESEEETEKIYGTICSKASCRP